MSNFKLEFTLKQHTPIIHFQADQAGATLRATELKPKLDRFLIEHVFKNNFEQYKEFLIGYKEPKGEKDKKLTEKDFEGKKAFDYKVRIISNIKDRNIKQPDKYLFFANSLLDKKVNSVITENIVIKFISFKSDLLTIIDDNIDYFFVTQNFGMRQSKGYGCFYRKDSKIKFIDALKSKYDFVYKAKNTQKNKFEKVVNNINKILKSGNNFRGYTKSLLFQYACEELSNYRWEKRKIKQYFSEVHRKYHKRPIDCKITEDKYFRYIRAVLGISDNYEYNRGPKQGGERINISHDKIKRFKSPLLFKIFNNDVYLVFDDSYKKLLEIGGKYFFELEGTNKSFKIETFNKSEFYMENFLNYVCSHKDGNDLLERIQNANN